MKKLPPTAAEQASMVNLYVSGLKVVDVCRETGFCVATVSKFLKRNGCALRPRGKVAGTGPVRGFADKSLVSFKSEWDRLSAPEKGTISETYAKNRLAEMGFDVWEPFCQNHKTDIIILSHSTVKRLQVKSATYDVKIKAFRANVTRGRRGGKRSDYTLGDVDFFVVYCGGLSSLCFYIVPAKLVIGRTDLKLYPHREKGKDSRGIGWEAYKNAFGQLSK